MQKKLLARHSSCSLAQAVPLPQVSTPTLTFPRTTQTETANSELETAKEDDGIDGIVADITTNEGTTTLELDATASTQLFTVTASNFAFAPAAMTVKRRQRGHHVQKWRWIS